MRLQRCVRFSYDRGIANAELEGEAPTTLAAGVASEPALTAEDAGNALGDGFAAPAARGHDERAAELIVPRAGPVLVEATTTVAVTIAVASEIHGCTLTSYCGKRQDFRVTCCRRDYIGFLLAKPLRCKHLNPILILYN